MKKARKFIPLIAPFIVLGLISSIGYTLVFGKPQDVRPQVVRLSSSKGMCSGEQVKAKSGFTYILSAAHCKNLSEDGETIKVTTEDHRELQRRIITIDSTSDLMLLEGVPGLEGLNIAKSLNYGESLTSFTHGNDFPIYETRGVAIADQKVEFIIGAIAPDDTKSCNSGVLHKLELGTIFGNVTVCVFSSEETFTTVMIVPGSSGGALVNNEHELVGVASVSAGQFSGFVELKDIKRFLSNY